MTKKTSAGNGGAPLVAPLVVTLVVALLVPMIVLLASKGWRLG
jgi:hypothetical protein